MALHDRDRAHDRETTRSNASMMEEAALRCCGDVFGGKPAERACVSHIFGVCVFRASVVIALLPNDSAMCANIMCVCVCVCLQLLSDHTHKHTHT